MFRRDAFYALDNVGPCTDNCLWTVRPKLRRYWYTGPVGALPGQGYGAAVALDWGLFQSLGKGLMSSPF